MNIEGLDEMQFFDSRRAIIPSDNKLSILKDLSDLGFDSGKNPERVINEVSRCLDFVYDYPFVVPQDSRNGKPAVVEDKGTGGNSNGLCCILHANLYDNGTAFCRF